LTNETIPAATILLLRDQPAFEVLLIERHANIAFAGGALVFPGGRIGKGDYDPAWAGMVSGFDAIAEEQRAPRIAAIREAFEETGILLARREGEAAYVDDAYVQSLTAQRKIVENDDAKFLALVKAEKLVLACDALCLFARWAPPASVRHRRFDTWFFAAKTPARQNAREDGNEATEALWTTPAAALEACANGQRKMIFPTSRNLELLDVSDSADAAIGFAGERTIELVQPEIIERDGEKFLTIPTHLGYPVTEEALETAFRS
jgi:8-oxo-dGTP pyrophosphatase MutT (NUDIX family)